MQKELAFQSSVEELKTSVSEGKALVAAAVTDKGVETAADAAFVTIANNIRAIPVGSEYIAVQEEFTGNWDNVETITARLQYPLSDMYFMFGISVYPFSGEDAFCTGFYYTTGQIPSTFSIISGTGLGRYDPTTRTEVDVDITSQSAVFYSRWHVKTRLVVSYITKL